MLWTFFSLQHTELRLVTGWSSRSSSSSSWLTPLGAARVREEDTILTSNCSCGESCYSRKGPKNTKNKKKQKRKTHERHNISVLCTIG
jgi:hypothetical protein